MPRKVSSQEKSGAKRTPSARTKSTVSDQTKLATATSVRRLGKDVADTRSEMWDHHDEVKKKNAKNAKHLKKLNSQVEKIDQTVMSMIVMLEELKQIDSAIAQNVANIIARLNIGDRAEPNSGSLGSVMSKLPEKGVRGRPLGNYNTTS